MRTIENGMVKIRQEGATTDDIQREHPNDLLVVEVVGRGTRVLKPGEKLTEGARIHSIPPIVKGSDSRIAAEVEILKRIAGNRSPVMVGSKTVANTRFMGVLIKNVKLSSKKFDVSCTDMLFLVPERYPVLPPVGCYLNYRWSTADHHFTLRSYYDAPDLGKEGWFWYCVALGGGFDGRQWRPGTQPDNGHNLGTLFVTARHAINTEE